MLPNLLAQLNPNNGTVSGTFLAILVGVVVLVTLVGLARSYKRCPPNKVLVIYGKTGRGAAKCIHGGAALVYSVIQDFRFLDLEPFMVQIDLAKARSQDGIRFSVPATVTAAISTEPGVMENAAARLLDLSRQQIKDLAQEIILVQMRAVIARMKIDNINCDPQAFAAKVLEAVAVELAKIGLAVINVNIKDASTVEVEKVEG